MGATSGRWSPKHGGMSWNFCVPRQRTDDDVEEWLRDLEKMEQELAAISGELADFDASVAQEWERVDPFVIDADFEVAVVTERLPSRPHQRDGLAGLHFLPGLHQDFRVMPVVGDDAISVIDGDEFSVTAIPVRDLDATVAGGVDGSSGGSGEVSSAMEFGSVPVAGTDEARIDGLEPERLFFRNRRGGSGLSA